MQKQIECLYAWAEFYAKNERWDDYNKCQDQINDLRIKMKKD